MSYIANRKGGEITLDLGKDEVIGLRAFMAGDPNVTRQQAELGQFLYAWLFNEVQVLANNYGEETKIKFMKKGNNT